MADCTTALLPAISFSQVLNVPRGSPVCAPVVSALHLTIMVIVLMQTALSRIPEAFEQYPC